MEEAFIAAAAAKTVPVPFLAREEFEKDDDSNFHIDFITAASVRSACFLRCTETILLSFTALFTHSNVTLLAPDHSFQLPPWSPYCPLRPTVPRGIIMWCDVVG